MNLKLIKTVVGCSALMGVLQSATAQLPPVVATPAGLDPAIDILSAPYNTPNGGSAVTTGEKLFASGGDVTVTFLGPTYAGYDEHLFVESPANTFGQFFDNQSTANGLTYDLGTYAAGTEIEFGLYVDTTGSNWFDGPGSRNSDGDVHAYMINDFEGLANTTYVGFEDLPANGADWNYIDEVYAFTGAAASVNQPTVPDASSTLTLLGMAMGGLACFRRRFRS